MQFLATIKAVLSLLPLLVEAIKVLEAAFPQSGTGQAKLEVLKGTVQAAYSASNDAVGSFEQVWPVLQATVGGLVGVFNQSGLFKK